MTEKPSPEPLSQEISKWFIAAVLCGITGLFVFGDVVAWFPVMLAGRLDSTEPVKFWVSLVGFGLAITPLVIGTVAWLRYRRRMSGRRAAVFAAAWAAPVAIILLMPAASPI